MGYIAEFNRVNAERTIDLQLKLTQVLRGKLTHLSGGVVSK